MPSMTFGEMKEKAALHPAPKDNEPYTGWAANPDGTTTYFFEDREVEYLEYLDLLQTDRTRSGGEIDEMLKDAPGPDGN